MGPYRNTSLDIDFFLPESSRLLCQPSPPSAGICGGIDDRFLQRSHLGGLQGSSLLTSQITAPTPGGPGTSVVPPP